MSCSLVTASTHSFLEHIFSRQVNFAVPLSDVTGPRGKTVKTEKKMGTLNELDWLIII